MSFGRLVFMISVFLGSLVIPALPGPRKPAGSIEVERLIEEAINKNPDIIASKSKWEVTRERPLQAGSLDDPMIGLGIINLPTNNFSFRTEDMTKKEISITQRFPYPGKGRFARRRRKKRPRRRSGTMRRPRSKSRGN